MSATVQSLTLIELDAIREAVVSDPSIPFGDGETVVTQRDFQQAQAIYQDGGCLVAYETGTAQVVASNGVPITKTIRVAVSIGFNMMATSNSGDAMTVMEKVIQLVTQIPNGGWRYADDSVGNISNGIYWHDIFFTKTISTRPPQQ
ncbi:MAG: hypothetical protein IPF79_04650 [Ignavibacteria bacterium]|nr:hypothetical protein [Ignavibacteria bacterium]